MDKLYVMKFGGNAIRGHDDLTRLSKEVASMIGNGAKVIMVHGGGPEISEEMEKRGLVPKKINGVRVTDADGLEVAEVVLRRLNAEVVSCLQEAGVKALGMSGYNCTVCVKKAPMKAEDGTMVDLGLVGEVSECDPTSLLDLVDIGVVPVVYPIGKDASGTMLNVNADTMVAAIAASVGCSEMIAITDVPGILKDVHDLNSTIPSVNLSDIDALVEDGTISGGMIPKVEACRKAILAGVSVVRMVNGKDPDTILGGIMEGASKGTIITK